LRFVVFVISEKLRFICVSPELGRILDDICLSAVYHHNIEGCNYIVPKGLL